MKQKRAGRELFEVFRPEAIEKKSRSWWHKAPEKESEAAAPKQTRPRTARRDVTTPPGRVTLTFSREALIFAGVMAAGAVFGAFALGYARGATRNPARSEYADTSAAGPADPQPFGSLDLSLRNLSRFFTLRLFDRKLTYQQATEMLYDLRAMGYSDAFVTREGDSYALNVGRYADYRTKEAREFKEQIKAVVYKGERWFANCSWREVNLSKE